MMAVNLNTPVSRHIQRRAAELLTDPERRPRIKRGENFYRDGHLWCRYECPSEDMTTTYHPEICAATGEALCDCEGGQHGNPCYHRLAIEQIELGIASALNYPMPGLEL